MRTLRTPNRALRALLAEAGWSGARLAREVNALGAAQGVPLHYDRTSVAHWLAGTRPRPPAPHLAAEALSRHLARRLRPSETGLTGPELPLTAPDGVSFLDGTLRAGGGAGTYVPGALIETGAGDGGGVGLGVGVGAGFRAEVASSTSPVLNRHPPQGSYPTRDTPVGMAHVDTARHLLTVLSRDDDTFGAGAVRVPLRRFLSTALLPWLRGSPPPAVRRELLSVAAQLTYLCAFLSYDCGRQADGQRLYLASAGLARENGDRAGYALALRGLSVQAYASGHFREARDLAEEAARLGVRYAPVSQHAFYLGQLAVAQAGLGEGGCVSRLVVAERCLERDGGSGTPVGGFHAGALAVQEAAVRRARGDLRGAAGALERSARLRPADERRSRAVYLAELADVQLDLGNLDRACAAGHAFLELHAQVDSARVDDRLRRLTARLRPHARQRAAGGLLERARAAWSGRTLKGRGN